MSDPEPDPYKQLIDPLSKATWPFYEMVGLLLPIVIYHSRIKHRQMVLMVDNEAPYLGLAKETN